MSIRLTRPAVVGAPANGEDRLAAVLAAGLKRFPKLAVADTGIPPAPQAAPPQPGGLAPAGSSLEELVRTLPNELKQQILLSREGISCKEIARLCGLDREFRELCQLEDFWRAMCERFGYTIPRLLEANGLPRDDRSWRAHYELYCIYGVPPDNQTQVFEMVQGEERLVRLEYNNGNVQFYEGSRGEERNVRSTSYNNGMVYFFEGPRGQERLVRQEHTNSDGTLNVILFDGSRGQERLVRMTTIGVGGDGVIVQFFEGPHGQERKVRAEIGTTVYFFEGPPYHERMVRATYPTGEVHFFEGPRGQERKVRKTYPDGSVKFFEGPRGQERMVRKTQ